MEGRTMTKEGKETMIPDDPVLAAIEAHRSAWKAETAAMDRADGVLAMKEGRTVTPEDVEAKKQAKRATNDAMTTLHKTAPVTMAGLGAAIGYLIEWDEGEMGDDASTGLQALLGSPLFEVKPRENVAWNVLFDLTTPSTVSTG
jgi:hypothetical protein